MNINETVVIKNETYLIYDRAGSGGQGAVWRARRQSDGKTFAIKTIEEKDSNRRREKIHNIQKLINEKLNEKTKEPGMRQHVKLVFPICYFIRNNGGETGYVMDHVSGETLNSMLMTGKIEKLSTAKKLELVKKIAASVKILHDFGYCYTDINWGNFMWNEQEQMMYVIDCENVASRTEINEGKCAFLKGTGFFMAPEVAFEMENAADNADKYALATLIFRILTNNVLQSAYHGKAMYSAVPACMSMDDVKEYEDEDDIDRNWRKFIFDKTDKSNSIDDLFKNNTSPKCKAFRKELEQVMDIWKKTDDRIKELFYQAFNDPFDFKSRPTASKWVRVIDEVLSNKKGPEQTAVRPTPAKPAPTGAACASAKGGQADRYPTFVPRGSAAPTNNKYKPFIPRGQTGSTDNKKN